MPLAEVRTEPGHLAMLEEWMRTYSPDEIFDTEGKFVADLAALAPSGERRISANPHANGGKLLSDLDLPDFRDYAIEVDAPRPRTPRVHPPTRQDAARHIRRVTPAHKTSGFSAPTKPIPTGSATSSRSKTVVS